MTNDLLQRAEQILEPFDQQNPDGTYLFSDTDVRRFVPLLFILSEAPLDPSQMTPELKEAMEAFLTSFGLSFESELRQIYSAAREYYQSNPPNPALLAELRQILIG